MHYLFERLKKLLEIKGAQYVFTNLLPLLFFHTCSLLLVAGIYALETGGLKYDCAAKEYLRAAAYGTLAVCTVSGLVEFAILGVGLHGM